MKNVSPTLCFIVCKVLGFSLLFAFWLRSSDIAGFFLILTLVGMSLLRQRMPNLKPTVIIDIVACIMINSYWEYSAYALALPLFQAMFLGFYPALIVFLYLIPAFSPMFMVLLLFAAVSGFYLRLWQTERSEKFKLRDKSAERYYDLENLQNGLTTALSQVERMTSVAERARISRDIHDNAGHEIVAAFISLQTVGKIMKNNPEKATELFDKSMERLDAGVKKMRDAVHNVSAVTFMGADKMQELCERFEQVPVKFKATGDMTCVTSNMWYVLEAVLNESLTNAMKHSRASNVCVELDVTKYLVRLMIENDGVTGEAKPAGSGVRNLKHRVNTVGGNLTVDASATFKVVCVIPIN